MCFLQAAAYHFTGDKKYYDEAADWYARGKWQRETNLDRPHHHYMETVFKDYIKPPVAENEYLFWEANVIAQFTMVSAHFIDLFTDLIKKDPTTDMNTIAKKWLHIFNVGIDKADYAPYYFFLVTPGGTSWRKINKTQDVPEDKWYFADPFFSALNEVRWSEPLSRFVTAAALMHGHLDDEGKKMAKDIVGGILGAVDGVRIQWIYDADNGTSQLHPNVRQLYHIISSEMPSSYLIAYWLGLKEGIVE